MTIKEKFGSFDGLKMCYSGDCYNNVTYDLMRACAILGMECHIACPDDKDYAPVEEVLKECEELNKVSGGKTIVFHDCKAACKDVDIVYCDSWMSYHIDKEQRERRLAALMPF